VIILKESYWQPIQSEIQNFLWLQFFDPIFDILDIKKPFQNSGTPSSYLQSAIKEGRINYQNGVFSGVYDIRSVKELSEFAVFDKRSHTWVGMPPPEIAATAARVKFEAKAINDKISGLLPKFQANFDRVIKTLGFPIWPVINSITGDLQNSLNDMAVLPELTPDAYKKLIDFYNDQQRLNIVNWQPEQMTRLRQVIEQNVKSGYNLKELENLIKQEWDVSANKAKFLARQETSLFVSRFRDERYQSAGVEEYIWFSSNDARCRDANKYGGPSHGPGGPLHGKKFRFDSPPASGTHGEHQNPGIPFGCRCIAKPVLPKA
jgi:SPP1 gp7 family putative phage head morphogenesis protein